jgi:hypothetical protein
VEYHRQSGRNCRGESRGFRRATWVVQCHCHRAHELCRGAVYDRIHQDRRCHLQLQHLFWCQWLQSHPPAQLLSLAHFEDELLQMQMVALQEKLLLRCWRHSWSEWKLVLRRISEKGIADRFVSGLNIGWSWGFGYLFVSKRLFIDNGLIVVKGYPSIRASRYAQALRYFGRLELAPKSTTSALNRFQNLSGNLALSFPAGCTAKFILPRPSELAKANVSFIVHHGRAAAQEDIVQVKISHKQGTVVAVRSNSILEDGAVYLWSSFSCRSHGELLAAERNDRHEKHRDQTVLFRCTRKNRLQCRFGHLSITCVSVCSLCDYFASADR